MTSLFPADLYAAAEGLLTELQRHALLIATAESCTGGLLAGVLTEVPGSSGMVERGLVPSAKRWRAQWPRGRLRARRRILRYR
jgi:nicotinamide mononucleotide (NMN) deamidase PncC